MSELWISVQERLEQLRVVDTGKPRKHVVVLGAGMAGLVAATELVALGHTVEVLEGSDRVGGRIFTHRFSSGQYHELGAMRVPSSHDYTRHYAGELGLAFRPFLNDIPNGRYDLRGQMFATATLSQNVVTAFPGLAANEAADIQARGIFAPGIDALVAAEQGLSAQEKRDLFAGKLSDLLQQRDRLSFKEAMRMQGWSLEALTLLGTATALEDLWDRGQLMLLRDHLAGNSDGLEEIVGGMDLLPRGLAQNLGGRVRMGHYAERIDVREDGKVFVGLRTPGGDRESRVADHVLCTLPFGVMRKLELGGLSTAKQTAIRNLSYVSSSKVILHCTERFWEQQGLVGGRSYTDGIARQVYYPNDGVEPTVAAGFRAAAPTPRIYRGIFAPPEPAAFPAGFVATTGPSVTAPPATARGPGALLASYTWGADAQRIGALPRSERPDVVRQSIRALHPQIDAYIDDAVSMFWDEYPFARGAFADLKPGDLSDYLPAARQREGGMHFAGEHVSPLPGWIQGACYSALEALEGVLA